MTTLYYLPKSHITGNLASLPEEEAHHAVKVVRHKVGEVIHAVDGEGGWYKIQLNRVSKRIAEGEIIETRLGVGESEYDLTVAMSLLKNQKRYDLFVEKAVELGVTRIVPLITARTEKKTLKEARLDKILIAAMKQCGRSRKVELGSVEPFESLVENNTLSLSLCCHEGADKQASLFQQLSGHMADKTALIAIGPEGGFTNDEVEYMKGAGFAVVTLGPRRLRAETAAIVACTEVMLHWTQ